jgi:hypothetical protein
VRGEAEGGFFKAQSAQRKTNKSKKGVMDMEGNKESGFAQASPDRPEQKPQVEETGWKVTDEEIDRVIKKLEEGWGV